MNNNKKIGNISERKLIKLLCNNYYWSYLFPNTINGQPCDVIAFNKDTIILIDVKHCESNRFNTSRIEPNQLTTFEMVNKIREDIICGIVVYFYDEDIPYFIRYSKDLKKSYSKEEMILFEPILNIK